jgi:hypothetical protein
MTGGTEDYEYLVSRLRECWIRKDINSRTNRPTDRLIRALKYKDQSAVDSAARCILRFKRDRRYQAIRTAVAELKKGCNLKMAHRTLKPLTNPKKSGGFPEFITHNGANLTREEEIKRRITDMAKSPYEEKMKEPTADTKRHRNSTEYKTVSDIREKTVNRDIFLSDTGLRVGIHDQKKYADLINGEKATGPDGIPMSLIKDERWWPMLMSVANRILAGKGAADMWGSRLVLLDKRKGDQTTAPSSDDVRQIAIQNLVVKIAEHKMLEQIRKDLRGRLSTV